MPPIHTPRALGPALAASALALAALALAGCGGGGTNGVPTGTATGTTPTAPTGPTTTTHVAVQALYVADAGNDDVPVVGIDTTGTPFALGSPAALPGGASAPHDVVLDPTQTFALVTSGGAAPRLSAYRINADLSLPSAPAASVALPGLTALSHSALAAIAVGGSVYVYVAGAGTNALYAYRLDTGTGALTAIPNAAPATGPGAARTPASLVAYSASGAGGLARAGHAGAGTGSFLLVGDTSPDVTNFVINADGTLSDTTMVSAGNAGPVLVAAPVPLGTSALSGTGSNVYAYDSGAQELYSYSVDSSGFLSQLADVPGTGAAGALIANPFGDALYVPQSGGATLTAYPVPTSGTNAGQPGAGVPTTAAGAALAAGATDGATLGVVDTAHSRVLLYALNGDGSLGAAQAPYSLSGGSDPVAVALSAPLLNAYARRSTARR